MARFSRLLKFHPNNIIWYDLQRKLHLLRNVLFNFKWSNLSPYLIVPPQFTPGSSVELPFSVIETERSQEEKNKAFFHYAPILPKINKNEINAISIFRVLLTAWKK